MKPTIGIDVDDVLYSCNGYAVSLANQEYKMSPPLELKEITSWGKRMDRSDVIFKYYKQPSFFENQPIAFGAQKFLKKLTEIADVYITTAVEPEFMSIRIQRLLNDFPFIPKENIIMGFNKSLFHFDILLDDNPENILKSKCTFPILYRKPWNQHLMGGLVANDLTAAYHLITKLINLSPNKTINNNPLLIFVGSSGSGKTAIMNALDYPVVPSVTTRKKRDTISDKNYHFVTKEEFLSMGQEFLESSCYADEYYGTRKSDAEPSGIIKMKAMDISGALSVKNNIKDSIIIYVKRPRKEIIKSILQRETSLEDKVVRLESLPYEEKNERLCDFVLNNDGTIKDAVNKIKAIIKGVKQL